MSQSTRYTLFRSNKEKRDELCVQLGQNAIFDAFTENNIVEFSKIKSIKLNESSTFQSAESGLDMLQGKLSEDMCFSVVMMVNKRGFFRRRRGTKSIDFIAESPEKRAEIVIHIIDQMKNVRGMVPQKGLEFTKANVSKANPVSPILFIDPKRLFGRISESISWRTLLLLNTVREENARSNQKNRRNSSKKRRHSARTPRSNATTRSKETRTPKSSKSRSNRSSKRSTPPSSYNSYSDDSRESSHRDTDGNSDGSSEDVEGTVDTESMTIMSIVEKLQKTEKKKRSKKHAASKQASSEHDKPTRSFDTAYTDSDSISIPATTPANSITKDAKSTPKSSASADKGTPRIFAYLSQSRTPQATPADKLETWKVRMGEGGARGPFFSQRILVNQHALMDNKTKDNIAEFGSIKRIVLYHVKTKPLLDVIRNHGNDITIWSESVKFRYRLLMQILCTMSLRNKSLVRDLAAFHEKGTAEDNVLEIEFGNEAESGTKSNSSSRRSPKIRSPQSDRASSQDSPRSLLENEKREVQKMRAKLKADRLKHAHLLGKLKRRMTAKLAETDKLRSETASEKEGASNPTMSYTMTRGHNASTLNYGEKDSKPAHCAVYKRDIEQELLHRETVLQKKQEEMEKRLAKAQQSRFEAEQLAERKERELADRLAWEKVERREREKEEQEQLERHMQEIRVERDRVEKLAAMRKMQQMKAHAKELAHNARVAKEEQRLLSIEMERKREFADESEKRLQAIEAALAGSLSATQPTCTPIKPCTPDKACVVSPTSLSCPPCPQKIEGKTGYEHGSLLPKVEKREKRCWTEEAEYQIKFDTIDWDATHSKVLSCNIEADILSEQQIFDASACGCCEHDYSMFCT